MVDDFTKLEVWQDASNLTTDIYELSSQFPSEEKYNLTSQLKRSAVSIVSNIAEASGRYHYKDKVNFLFNARGSLEETRSHLKLAKKLGYVNSEEVGSLDTSLITLRKKLHGLIRVWKKEE